MNWKHKYLQISITLLEHVSFVWLGLFALFVIQEKTVWSVPEAIAAIATLLLYALMCIATRGKTTNAIAMLCGGVAMALLWYEMALESLVESSGAILLFTLPVLAIWSLRSAVVYDERFKVSVLAWLGVLLIGCAIFLPMTPARDASTWNQDPDEPRHSVRSALAAMTMFLAVVAIVVQRAHGARSQFSLRSFLLMTVVTAGCLALCVKLNPELKPNLMRHSHISVRFVHDIHGKKRMTYSVRVYSGKICVVNYQFDDLDPGDGQFERVICGVPGYWDLECFSNDPSRFKASPATPRMLAVWSRILQTMEEPLRTHEAVWGEQHSIDQPIYEGVFETDENKLVVPLPDDQATQDAYRLYDDAGNLVP